jgi:hypothetical protein
MIALEKHRVSSALNTFLRASPLASQTTVTEVTCSVIK